MKLKYDDAKHAYYLDGVRCKSITTVAKIPDDTYALEQWRKRMVAIGMAMSPPLVERVAAHFDNRDQVDEAAEEAMMLAKAHEAAGRGTAAHRITERIDLDETVIDTPLARAVREAWISALEDAGLEIVPEYVERIVVYPDHRICGRFDRLARRWVDGRLVVLDLKTGANAVKYPHSIATQLAMYANAPLMAGPLPAAGGTTQDFEPLPAELDRERGVVVHMPAEDKAEVVEIDIAAGWSVVERSVFPVLEWRKRQNLTRQISPVLVLSEDQVPAVGSSVATTSELAAGQDGSEPGQQQASDPSANDIHPDRFGWAYDRIEAIKAAGDEPKRRLAALWSEAPEIPTFPKGGPRTNDELSLIVGWCDLVEMEFELPFGPSDPTAPKATKQERAKA